jgi:arylsulfatase
MAAYAGCVDSIDQNIGKLLKFLKESGNLDDTLLLFLSDNGACQEGGTLGKGDEAMVKDPPLETTDGVRIGLHWAIACNTPYRLYKHYVHEGGACTPMIAHWPAGIAPQDRGSLIAHKAYLQDLMTTILDLSGASYPTGIAKCEGRSILPLLAGVRKPVHFDPMFWEHEGNAAVRLGRWKLVREYQQPWELYDFTRDRTELDDLADEKSVLRREMTGLWEQWAKRIGVAFPERFNMYEYLKQQRQAK